MKRKTKAILYTFLIIFIIAAILTLSFYYPQIAIPIMTVICMVIAVYATYMIIYINLKD
jgi:hypothetical protein